jgi:predicted TIM-barrel fold metal-dependent hydrolase
MSSTKNTDKAKGLKDRSKPPGLLGGPLPMIEDDEGDRVPDNLPPIVDAHVHLFPDTLFASIWQWFDQYGWPIRYKLKSPDVIAFLLSRGIDHIVALHYAHKPGIARELNAYMANVCRSNPRVTGLATVMPGEKDSADILKDAFENGLGGVKLHSHVQCFDVLSPDMHIIYEACINYDKPLLMHVGREPKSPAYRCDPHELCSADKVEEVLKTYAQLKVCVPHMGIDETGAYQNMVEKYDNLWLDTTMTLAEYLGSDYFPKLHLLRSDRILFGTDFPHLPYAWDRELRRLCELNLPQESLALILGGNARELFAIR